ncbi:MAG: vitamin K epoxide reductase family protein [Proteobacteria bacterium]|nr:vitamin K epoxide reductase family protein [Pseudomonadota bacterium]
MKWSNQFACLPGFNDNQKTVTPLAPQIRKLHLIQIVAACLGTALSIYLLVHHTRVNLGIQDSSSFCSFGGLADCDVNVSKYSEVAGVPLAAIGAIYFFVLLILGLLVPPKNPNFQIVGRFLAWLSSWLC